MSRTILLVESDLTVGTAIRDSLAQSSDGTFHIEWVKSCSAAMERLALEVRDLPQSAAIDAVLADLELPDSAGIATFDLLFGAAPQVPILVLCSAPDEDDAKLSVQRGAQDYLLKDRLDGYLLPKAVGSMIERAANADALFEEKERAQVTLNSIGDAVISTDVRGRVTYLNAVAEKLTGWTREDAVGRAFEEVFQIVDATTRDVAANPMAMAIRENRTVNLAHNCLLIRLDGVEAAIEDSAAPIHDRHGHVTGAVIVFHDVSVARELSLRMSHLAQHDSLTDLPNRILLNDRLSEALGMAHRHGRNLAVLFLDLDRFKNINDSLGHVVGDRLLQSVAKRLLACVRASDTVSRQGGDEFVILLSELAQPGDAAVTAEKILDALRAPHRIDERNLHLTASIGIVAFPDDGADAESLMRNADHAMYQAKGNGRDTYQFFAPDMNTRAVERQTIENGLRQALERHEFVLHYQPRMDLNGGAILGVEALVRWRHPERGLVLPAEFIGIAEECGLIVPLGRWVLREACRQARVWEDDGIASMLIAVNISAVELRAKDFIADVRATLKETGLAPRFLELEITETFLMQGTDRTAGVLDTLKSMGVQLALDDFGTGYSSLSYLKRFPIDTLKIDRSFVRDLTTDLEDASIVKAVISMAKSLNMQVVAEGVETREQLAFLRQRNCPEGQGFYFSPALPADDVTRLLMHSDRPEFQVNA